MGKHYQHSRHLNYSLSCQIILTLYRNHEFIQELFVKTLLCARYVLWVLGIQGLNKAGKNLPPQSLHSSKDKDRQ